MKIKIAINGFGRIGRLVFRKALGQKKIKIMAVNDLSPPERLAYLLKYDSTHGLFPGRIQPDVDAIRVDGERIKVLCEKDPEKLPWKSMGIDYVIEATGLFTRREGAEKHLRSGAGKVIITAPGKGDIPVFVMGVNHRDYRPSIQHIVSNASCTTNCLAPIVKILSDQFGIEEGLMTTIHALTASQPVVDGHAKKGFRSGRGALQNIIPSSTGAADAVGCCLPAIKGKLTGMAFRVPIADVSCVDLTVKLQKKTSYSEICQKMKEASQGEMKGILGYTDEEVVSSDFIGSPYSSVFDALAGIPLNETFYKLISWYDNETGYSQRVIDLLLYMASKEF